MDARIRSGLSTLLAGAAALATLAPGPASAGPDELIVAVEPGYGRLSRQVGSQNEVGGTVSAWLGLSESFWLALSGGAFQGLSDVEDRDAVLRYEAFGGLVATLDVFRVVPYLEAMLGIVGVPDEVEPTVRLGVGADYLLSPEWAVGAVLRYRPLPEEDIASAAITAQLRLGYRFSW